MDGEFKPPAIVHSAQINCPSSGKRTNHASVLFKNFIITFGGYKDRELKDIISFNTKTREWKTVDLKEANPVGRSGHSMCLAQGDNIVVYGGSKTKEVAMNEVGIMTISQLYDELMIEWKVLNGNGPRRALHVAHIYENQMFVFGGHDEAYNSTNDLWKLDLDTLTWSHCSPFGDIPEARQAHCSALYENKMYVFGGYSTQREEYFNDLHVLDLKTMTWHKLNLQGTGPTPRKGASALEAGAKIFFFGGIDSNKVDSSELFSYSISENLWQRVQINGDSIPKRGGHTSIYYKYELYIWGGENSQDDYLSDIYSIYLGGTVVQSKNIQREIQGSFPLKNLLHDPSFADFKFKVQGEVFQAHKVILSKRSKVFYDMFTNREKPIPSEIEINNIKPDTFRAFLGYLYCEDIEVDEDLAIEFLSLADEYLLPDLKKRSENLLIKLLNENNLERVKKAAETSKSIVLEKAVLEFNK